MKICSYIIILKNNKPSLWGKNLPHHIDDNEVEVSPNSVAHRMVYHETNNRYYMPMVPYMSNNGNNRDDRLLD